MSIEKKIAEALISHHQECEVNERGQSGILYFDKVFKGFYDEVTAYIEAHPDDAIICVHLVGGVQILDKALYKICMDTLRMNAYRRIYYAH